MFTEPDDSSAWFYLRWLTGEALEHPRLRKEVGDGGTWSAFVSEVHSLAENTCRELLAVEEDSKCA